MLSWKQITVLVTHGGNRKKTEKLPRFFSLFCFIRNQQDEGVSRRDLHETKIILRPDLGWEIKFCCKQLKNLDSVSISLHWTKLEAMN